MHKLITSIIRQEKLENVTSALKKEQIAFTYSEVRGYCREIHLYKEDIHSRIKIEIIADENDSDRIKTLIMENACCGLEGDGCLSIFNLEEYLPFDNGKTENLN